MREVQKPITNSSVFLAPVAFSMLHVVLLELDSLVEQAPPSYDWPIGSWKDGAVGGVYS